MAIPTVVLNAQLPVTIHDIRYAHQPTDTTTITMDPGPGLGFMSTTMQDERETQRADIRNHSSRTYERVIYYTKRAVEVIVLFDHGSASVCLGTVDLPKLPPAQLACYEHARRLARCSAEREHDRLLCATCDTLLARFDSILGEFEA